MKTFKYVIKENRSGPAVSRVTWWAYRYIVRRMRKVDYPSCWLSDGRLSESAGFRRDLIETVRRELKAASLMDFEITDFGARYSLPNCKGAARNG